VNFERRDGLILEGLEDSGSLAAPDPIDLEGIRRGDDPPRDRRIFAKRRSRCRCLPGPNPREGDGSEI